VNVGDRVTIVHGLPPDGVDVGTVASLARTDGKILIRFPAGGTLWVEPQLVDAGNVHVAPHRHRATDPDTARMAAHRTAEQLREHHWLVLSALVSAGSKGMIDHEHEQINGLNQDSAGKRRGELVELGLVENSRQRRQSPRGRPAIVWQVTARGLAVYRNHREGAA
jgi:hypothetical protein